MKKKEKQVIYSNKIKKMLFGYLNQQNNLDVALDYIRENPRVKLMGYLTKEILILKKVLTETKITKRGRII